MFITSQAAIKILDLQEIAKKSRTGKTVPQLRERVLREVSILQHLQHENIVRLFDAIEDGHKIYIVMELAEGGELFDYLAAQRRLSESQARLFFRQLVSVIEYCHANFVIHRDLKLENILLDKSLNLKVVDFGLSNFITPGKLLETHCGSYHYTAPEVMDGGGYTGPSSDIWSLGVILYAFVFGSLRLGSLK